MSPQLPAYSSPAPLSSATGRSGTVARVAGLDGFALAWAFAMLFSIAGDHAALMGRHGATAMALGWLAVAAAVGLIAGRRMAPWLVLLALAMVLRYMLALPVASNNKTIAVFMNVAILAFAWPCLRPGAAAADRAQVHARLRAVARGLLAVMYFYGIFHKINADFLDTSVSCAVALYRPLAAPLGLDGNAFGHQLAIWMTFIVEGIALVALYWRRWFAVGMVLALMFHFVIPISAFSWYMDFSSLVFALYLLSMPPEASARIGAALGRTFAALRAQALQLAGATLALVAIGYLAVRWNLVSLNTGVHLHHSVMLLAWAIYGGFMMVAMSGAALAHLPCTEKPRPAQPWFVHAVPALLFLSCLSPYLGLKTESSIAMFSNLHTEGGVTNHLLFDKPPYLFDYQQEVVEIVASSSPALARLAAQGDSMVLFALKEHLRWHPQHWVSYRHDGVLHRRVSAANFAPQDFANRLESKLLIFKPVDYSQPKPCTH